MSSFLLLLLLLLFLFLLLFFIALLDPLLCSAQFACSPLSLSLSLLPCDHASILSFAPWLWLKSSSLASSFPHPPTPILFYFGASRVNGDRLLFVPRTTLFTSP